MQQRPREPSYTMSQQQEESMSAAWGPRCPLDLRTAQSGNADAQSASQRTNCNGMRGPAPPVLRQRAEAMRQGSGKSTIATAEANAPRSPQAQQGRLPHS